MVWLPKPDIFAPIEIKNSPRSTTSGSLAALSITVMPVAKVAAVIMFSVAPTLGNSRVIFAPFKPEGALAIIKPCSDETCAPISVKPFI